MSEQVLYSISQNRLLENLAQPHLLGGALPDDVETLSGTLISQLLGPRKKNSHKGDFGHVLIVGGDAGMAGAVRLAAEAALRVGAGLVSVATHGQQAALVCAHYPEIMCHDVSNPEDLLPLLAKATVIVVGPGLGQHAWGEQLLKLCLAVTISTVIDADALNLLGERPQAREHWVLTPHPGEAARLLGWPDATAVQENRFKAIETLSALNGTWVLKGAETLIKSGAANVKRCPFGNPGMASGGMGDALSGIIGGLIAQKISLKEAAALGVVIHALAGDLAACEGERGLLASDLIKYIRTVLASNNVG